MPAVGVAETAAAVVVVGGVVENSWMAVVGESNAAVATVAVNP